MMAHIAYLDDDNIVTQVIVGPDEEGETDWEQYFSDKGKGRAVRTSYNTYGGVHYTDGEPSADQTKAFRYNYAGLGYTFDETKGTDGAFIPPKPFDSWILNEDTCLWEAPVPYPGDGLAYSWDETLGDWVEIQEPSA